MENYRNLNKKMPVTQLSCESIKALLHQLYGENAKFLDLEFLPVDQSVLKHVNTERKLDIAIHWRRPDDFLDGTVDNVPIADLNKLQTQKTLNQMSAKLGVANADQNKIHVFYDSIEPSDIKKGSKHSALANDYFLSAVSLLASRPPLIERLFITKEYNPQGIYRL
jgi:calpain-15